MYWTGSGAGDRLTHIPEWTKLTALDLRQLTGSGGARNVFLPGHYWGTIMGDLIK